MTTQKEIRRAFWEECFGHKPPQYRGKSQNQLPADVRMTFVDFVDHLRKSGHISEKLAERVTL